MNKRQICTADNPWQNNKEGKAIHPDAVSISEDYGWYSTDGDYERYECPHCKLQFVVELGS